MTLIELLVVIVILTTLVAAAIPLLSPSNDDRRLREAARGLNTYITGAQARAASTHRPFGVAIKRLSSDTKRAEDNALSLEVFYIEQLPPYTGFDPNAKACVAIHPDLQFHPGLVLIRFGAPVPGSPPRWQNDPFPPHVVRPGDIVEINGNQFRLLPDNNNQDLVNFTFDKETGTFYEAANNRPVQILALPINNSGQQINPKYDDAAYELPRSPTASPYWTSPAAYKVFRQPTSTSDEPYQLPEGTAIDLRASGVGSEIEKFFYVPGKNDNSQGVAIMFTPEGRVGRVAFYKLYPPASPDPQDQPFDDAVVDNVYLLVGRRDRIAAPAVATDQTLNTSSVAAATTDEARAKLREPINWLNGSSRWIVIGAQTGRVATIENAAVDLAGVLNQPLPPFQTASPSTEEMRCAQILAAREFTREMGQLGGR